MSDTFFHDGSSGGTIFRIFHYKDINRIHCHLFGLFSFSMVYRVLLYLIFFFESCPLLIAFSLTRFSKVCT